MARFLIIEEERGTYRGHAHPHNGCYAGDLSTAVSALSAPATVRSSAAEPGASPWPAGAPTSPRCLAQ
ncbi:MAG TPA: hypothetical protein VFI46_03795 [Jiangellaceae bacterium]|nr:hypothetical protein [Jiangellaceae bacterium]